jgi:hypothetical protein
VFSCEPLSGFGVVRFSEEQAQVKQIAELVSLINVNVYAMLLI